MINYFAFIRHHWPLLGFGFLSVFWGNFGQSFFVSWFGGPIQESLTIGATGYGAAYSFATLVSALTVLWAGALIDQTALKRYSAAVALGLATATLVLALSPGFTLLCIGFYLLRLFGQALLPHTGITAMARYFDDHRGKAISLAGCGVPLGEMLLPLVAVALIGVLGWRHTLIVIAVLSVLVYIPLSRYLLTRAGIEAPAAPADGQRAPPSKAGGRALLLKDRRYWMALPGLSAAPFIVTGIFIHQDFIVTSKDWTPMLFASSFMAYGTAHWLGSLISGVLVDRHSAVRLLPLFLPSMTIAQLLLALGDGPWLPFVVMTLLGTTIGLGQPISNALWAEVYGTHMIGTIRSINVAVMVFASSLSPVTFGLLIDWGLSLTNLFVSLACMTLAGNIMLLFSYKLSAPAIRRRPI